jgi:tetratricopeptide (TPR) repeat protein
MRLKLIITLVLSVLTLSIAAQQQRRQAFSPGMIRQLSNSIFTIHLYGPDDKEFAIGSGFVISPDGLCVTNFHVLENAFSAVVKMQNGEKFKLRNIVDFNADADLVKFRLAIPPNRRLPALRIARQAPQQGEEIISISSPAGLEYTTSKGIVSAKRRIKKFGELIQVSSPFSEGSSGSPVMNVRGEVVGIATAYIKAGGQNIYFAVSAMTLSWLNKSRNIPLVNMAKDPLETRNVKYARYAYWTKEPARSIRFFNAELNKNPRNYIAMQELGFVYYNEGDYEAAKEKLSSANSIRSTKFNLYYMGLSLHALCKTEGMDKEKFDEAYNWLNKAVQTSSEPAFYYAMADLVYDAVMQKIISKGSIRMALDALEYSIDTYVRKLSDFRFDPDIAFILHGQINELLNNTSGALLDYDNAIKIDPNYYKGYYLRGFLKLKMGENTGAMSDEEMAYQLAANKYTNETIAEICFVQALIYYNMYGSTGNPAFRSSAESKLDEAYNLTGNEAYMELRKKIGEEGKKGRKKK